ISSSVGDPTAFPREAQKLLAGVRECDSKVSGGPPCAHAYSSEDHSALIVEVCRSVRNYAPGLYIFRAGQKWQYPWFDARFMAWACMERSKDGQATSYFAIWENDITGFHGLV